MLSVSGDIRTDHHPNTSRERCRCTNLLGGRYEDDKTLRSTFTNDYQSNGARRDGFISLKGETHPPAPETCRSNLEA
jgi:hypothetical protein